MNVVPVEVFRPIAEAWLAEQDSPQAGFELLGAATGLKADSWRKRFTSGTAFSRAGAEVGVGWWSRSAIAAVDVDAFLAAADLVHLWHQPPLEEYRAVVGLRCEDCGRVIEDGEYMPLDLMRPDPSASTWLWDATKQKLVHRPTQARPGGRRFRVVDLCTHCGTEALFARAPEYRHGRLTPPKRGGRPRLLDEAQLRTLHHVYTTRGFSMVQLARMLVDAGKTRGTFQGFYQSMYYGWRNLGLETRTHGVQVAMSRFGTDGTRSKHHKVQCSKALADGRRCTQWVRRIVTATGSQPAADGLCWNHGVGAKAAA